ELREADIRSLEHQRTERQQHDRTEIQNRRAERYAKAGDHAALAQGDRPKGGYAANDQSVIPAKRSAEPGSIRHAARGLTGCSDLFASAGDMGPCFHRDDSEFQRITPP